MPVLVALGMGCSSCSNGAVGWRVFAHTPRPHEAAELSSSRLLMSDNYS